MVGPQSNSTFAQKYMLDERRFANEPVNALLFSNRTSKRLRQAGVITIMSYGLTEEDIDVYDYDDMEVGFDE